MRDRAALVLPFLLVAAVTIVGGQLNDVDARGRVVDDTTGEGIAGATVAFGGRIPVTTGPTGEYALRHLPRRALVSAEALDHDRATVLAEDAEIRLAPLVLRVHADDPAEGRGVRGLLVFLEGSVIARGNENGDAQAKHPGKDRTILVCAPGYERAELSANGVRHALVLRNIGPGCPPEPPASPSPGPSRSPGATRSPEATRSPTPTPARTPGPSPSP